MKTKLTLTVMLGAACAINPLYGSAKQTFRYGARHAFAECVFELGRLGVIDLERAAKWSGKVYYWPSESNE